MGERKARTFDVGWVCLFFLSEVHLLFQEQLNIIQPKACFLLIFITFGHQLESETIVSLSFHLYAIMGKGGGQGGARDTQRVESLPPGLI